MKAPLLPCLAAVLVALVIPCGAMAADGDRDEVTATVAAFHGALAEGDSAAAVGVLADDLTVLESGHVETLAEYKGHHLGADMVFAAAVSSVRTVIDVVVEGDTAWLLSWSDVSGTFHDRPVEAFGAELMVLSRQDGEWKIRAIHWSSRKKPEAD